MLTLMFHAVVLVATQVPVQSTDQVKVPPTQPPGVQPLKLPNTAFPQQNSVRTDPNRTGAFPGTVGTQTNSTRSVAPAAQINGSSTRRFNQPPSDTRFVVQPADRGVPDQRNPVIRLGDRPGNASAVAPRIAANHSITPNLGTRQARSATELLTDAIQSLHARRMTGRSMSLLDALPESGQNSSRLQAAKRYWQLAIAVADYHGALAETDFLMTLTTPALDFQQDQLQATVAAASARSQEARVAALAAQLDLAEQLASGSDEMLPIPSDLPFVGKYRTHFQQYVSAGTWPVQLRRIDRSLPVILELIHARAHAVNACQQSLNSMARSYHQGQASLDQVLGAFQAWRDQKLAFLGAVRDYNHLIAEYAFSVAPSPLSRREAAAMLVKVPTSDQLPTLTGSTIRQATALSETAVQPVTLNPGWRPTQPPVVGQRN